MSTEIWTDFDPNLDLPPDIKNVTVISSSPDADDAIDMDAEIDVQTETFDDDDSLLDEEETADTLDTPSSFSIVSQTIRTGLDGSQVVDVVIEVEDVPGATNYNVRVTK